MAPFIDQFARACEVVVEDRPLEDPTGLREALTFESFERSAPTHHVAAGRDKDGVVAINRGDGGGVLALHRLEPLRVGLRDCFPGGSWNRRSGRNRQNQRIKNLLYHVKRLPVIVIDDARA